MDYKIGDDGFEPLSASDVHQMDQFMARFTDIMSRLITITMNGVQDGSVAVDPARAERDFAEFAATVHELDSSEIVSFISFLVATHIRQTLAIQKMSVNMGTVLDTVIECMADPAAKERFRAARVATFDDIKAREDLLANTDFSDMSVQALKPLESYTTGTGVRLLSIHRDTDCYGACVIHRPISGQWDAWPTDWDAENKMMLRVCPHGIKHPVIEDILRGHDPSHTCDGCPCGQTCIEDRLKQAFGELGPFEPGNPPTITIEFGEGETHAG